MSRLYHYLTTFLSFTLSIVAFSEVTLPTEDYLKLLDKSKEPNITSLYDLNVSGEFNKELFIHGNGMSSGSPQAATIMYNNTNFALKNCSGEAQIYSESNQYKVLPKKDKFQFKCQLVMKDWNSLNVYLGQALNYDINIKGADKIMNPSGQGMSVSVMPSQPRRNIATAEITAVARYNISLLPDENRFSYSLQLNNPNATKMKYSFPVRNQEVIQKTVYNGEYEIGEKLVEFNLQPGNNYVQIEGTLKTENFEAPLNSGQQFVLIQNHPSLQSSVKSDARRVSLADANMGAQFPSAKAFFVDGRSQFTWETKKLNVFSSVGYTIKNMDYLIYVPEKGKAVSELNFMIDNKGTPELPLKIPGDVTFLSVDGRPQVLSKDEEGNLLLQLESGMRSVRVQYQSKQSSLNSFASISEVFPRPDNILSNVNISVGLPYKWNVFMANSLNHFKSDFGFNNILSLFILFALYFLVLKKSGLQHFQKLIISLSIALLFKIYLGFELGIYFALALYVYRKRKVITTYFKKFYENQNKWRFVFGSFIFIAIFYVVTIFVSGTMQTFSRGQLSYNNHPQKIANGMPSYKGKAFGTGGGSDGGEGYYEEADMMMEEPSASLGAAGGLMDNVRTLSKAPAAAALPRELSSGDDYQGLPSAIEIPHNLKFISFSQGMLDKDQKPKVSLFLVNNGILSLIVALFSLYGFFLLYKQRSALKEHFVNV